MKITILVDSNFLDYTEFILGFGGVDTLYDITDEGIEALHKAYPSVKFVGEVNDTVKLELSVGLTEEECFGFLENRLVDNNGNILAENDVICTTNNDAHRNLHFKLNGEEIEIRLEQGGFKVNNNLKNVSNVVGTKRMNLL